MAKIELVQNTPGSWTHIDILVDSIKRFHAAKQGTNFWVIVDEDNKTHVGCGTGRSEVRSTVKEHLAKH